MSFQVLLSLFVALVSVVCLAVPTATRNTYNQNAEFEGTVTVDGDIILGTNSVAGYITTILTGSVNRTWTNFVGTNLYVNKGVYITNSSTISNLVSLSGQSSCWQVVNGSLSTGHFSAATVESFLNRSNWIFKSTSDQTVLTTGLTNALFVSHDGGTGTVYIKGIIYATAPTTNTVDMRLCFTGSVASAAITVTTTRLGTNFALGVTDALFDTATILSIDLDPGFTNAIYIDGFAIISTADSFFPKFSQLVNGSPSDATVIKSGSWMSYEYPAVHDY